MKIIVSGGRDYNDGAALDRALDALHTRRPITLLIEGGARGADWLARAWAMKRGVPYQEFPADWDTHGRAAGHIRNRQMLHEGRPQLVVAFPGGRGTDNMIENAAKFEVPVWRPYKEKTWC